MSQGVQFCELMFVSGHMVHCYRGFAGSIRCVECHPTLPLVASCGLDRYLRVHDLEETHLLHKVLVIIWTSQGTRNDKDITNN